MADQEAFSMLRDKDEIRELVLLYSRGVDRQDFELLRTLYTSDGHDDHAGVFCGSASDYVAFLERSLPYMHMSGHYVCNHLISVDGDTGEGEVYAIAHHIFPDGKGGMIEDRAGVRYIDQYRREAGRWRFSSRVVTFDFREARPIPVPDRPTPVATEDPSYTALSMRLFGRGPRA
jgi:hypothetical protein